MSEFEQKDYYRKALETAQKYLDEPQGFTTYLGVSNSDKTYPKPFNFQTALLCQLLEKVENLERQVVNLQSILRSDIEDSLSERFSQLKLPSDGQPIKKKVKPTWTYW